MNSLPKLLVLVLVLWSNVGVAPGQTPPSSTSQRPRVRVLAGGYGNHADGPGTTARFYQPAGIALGPDGVLYVADTENNRIRCVRPDGQVNTLAGSGKAGTVDGPAATAQFNNPLGIAVDARGTVYVTETYSTSIRKITSGGQVSTLTGLVPGTVSPGKAVRFASFSAIAVDAEGVLYVADYSQSVIHKITPSGAVSALPEPLPPGFTTTRSDTLVRMNNPSAVAVGGDGTVYVADTGEKRIYRISPSGRLSVLAGSQRPRASTRPMGIDLFREPNGLAVDAQSTVYVADARTGTIRKITPDGQISTLNRVAQVPTEAPRYAFAPGTHADSFPAAPFSAAWGLALGIDGTLYVGDRRLHGIVAISPEGRRRVLAGGGEDTRVDAQGLAARFQSPSGVAVSSRGTVYVADTDNHCIRKITASGQVSTLAGTGESGFTDGPGRTARFNSPEGVAVGPGDTVYVADTDNHRIRKITPQGLVSTVAGTGHRDEVTGASSAARFTRPIGVAVAANGAVYVVDSTNYVRRIAPNGRVTIVADLTPFGKASGTRLTQVLLHGVALVGDGTLYLTGPNTGHVYKVTRAGKASILAGCAPHCDPGEKRAGDHSFDFIRGIAVSATGTIYVADPDPNTVLRISPKGQVSILLNDSAECRSYRRADCFAPYRPKGVAVDASGRVYIADTGNNRILVVE